MSGTATGTGTGTGTSSDAPLTRPAGPSDLALPLALVHDLAQATAPTRRADEVRTAAASKRRGAGRRRKAAVRG
ncbi:hypothetical protein ACIQVO_25965 [Streptomyces sp. NPDC101062]|uniref:hypothetical protein n=1 Tax=unclassified Streptomyces TaxID=2593676 RepID=UPI0037F168BB